MTSNLDPLPTDLAAAHAMILAERAAGIEAEVFTITYVAEMLGEDEEWLHELSTDMFAEDGRLHVYSGKDDAVTRNCLH